MIKQFCYLHNHSYLKAYSYILALYNMLIKTNADILNHQRHRFALQLRPSYNFYTFASLSALRSCRRSVELGIERFLENFQRAIALQILFQELAHGSQAIQRLPSHRSLGNHVRRRTNHIQRILRFVVRPER